MEGIASDPGLDLQEQRIGLQSQQSMAWWARTGKVALGGEANHFQIAFDDDLGHLVDGCVSDKGEFFIRVELDRDNLPTWQFYAQAREWLRRGLN